MSMKLSSSKETSKDRLGRTSGTTSRCLIGHSTNHVKLYPLLSANAMVSWQWSNETTPSLRKTLSKCLARSEKEPKMTKSYICSWITLVITATGRTLTKRSMLSRKLMKSSTLFRSSTSSISLPSTQSSATGHISNITLGEYCLVRCSNVLTIRRLQ